MGNIEALDRKKGTLSMTVSIMMLHNGDDNRKNANRDASNEGPLGFY